MRQKLGSLPPLFYLKFFFSTFFVGLRHQGWNIMEAMKEDVL